MDIDSQIDAFFEPVAKVSSAVIFYSVPLMEGVDVKIILVWLACAAVFFTFYLGLSIFVFLVEHSNCFLATE